MDLGSKGWGSGLIGVIIFSGSLPATRVAIAGFDPIFLTAARAVIAAALAVAALIFWRQARPAIPDLVPLAIVAVGVVIGFPLLTSLALQHIPAARCIVFVGLLPLATAICGVIRGGERPRAAFWLFSCGGSLIVALYAWSQSGEGSLFGDLMMLAAIFICGLGYAEGAVLSRRLGGWQVISWALVLAAPLMFALSGATWPSDWDGVTMPVWLGLGYVSVFSMWLGFVFWYRGLALGGIAGVGQLQLMQPFFGLFLASVLLGEAVAWSMIAVTLLVVACVAGAKRFA